MFSRAKLLILASFLWAADKVLLANLVHSVLEHPIRELEVTKLEIEVPVNGDPQSVMQELSFGGRREDLLVGLLVGLPFDLKILLGFTQDLELAVGWLGDVV